MMPEAQSSEAPDALYVYGVVEQGDLPAPPCRGVDGREVYVLAGGTLGAIVHNCDLKPYASDDPDTAEKWVRAHNGVLERFMEDFAVLPCAFNTIIRDEAKGDPGEVARRWLITEGEALRERLQRLAGKAEYGLQVLWELSTVAQTLAGADQEVLALKMRMEESSRGMAYMLKEKLQRVIRSKLEVAATEFCARLMAEARAACDDLRVEANRRPDDGWVMVANWACLVRPGQLELLGRILEKPMAEPGVKVRLTGPWPAYSFAT